MCGRGVTPSYHKYVVPPHLNNLTMAATGKNVAHREPFIQLQHDQSLSRDPMSNWIRSLQGVMVFVAFKPTPNYC